jgi:prepilin-type N-terminal cleavage/methylation domain-containing protein
MLTGLIDKKLKVSISPPRSPSKSAGFTLVELMVASVIFGVVMSALLMTLQIGEFANGVGSAKVDLEAEVRMLVDWISKDIRQAKIQDLASTDNDPRKDHIKFRFWEWNSTSYNQAYIYNATTDTYVNIEYTYNNATEILSRKFQDKSGNVFYQNFTGISKLNSDPGSETGKGIFYTEYSDPTNNDFNSTILLNNRRITIAIKKEKNVRGSILNFTLVEEVKIRNE